VLAVLEETISALIKSEKQAVKELHAIHRIAKRKRILKDFRQILEAVFYAYANDQRIDSFYESAPAFLQFILRTLAWLSDDRLQENLSILESRPAARS
jgi:hypothetical protein